MWWLVLAAVIVTGPAEAGHYQASEITLGAPQTIVEIDTARLKGEPAMLAWSPDTTTLYLQMVERDRKGAITSTKHYIIVVSEKTTTPSGGQPAWVGKYWAWKSAPASPASAAFKIVPSEREEVKRAVAPVGELAKGGSSPDGRGMGTSVGEAVSAATTAQTLHIWTLKVNGETIGEWTNEAVTPGSNFAWAPAPARAIVYAKRDGGPLLLLDDRGRKETLAGSKNASFPAWSDAGSRLAWLEKKDRKKYDLIVADVAEK